MPFHQTAPTSHFDREVRSKPRIPDIVLALPFPLVCLGSVCKETWSTKVFICQERVAAALLIAAEAACSSKASRAVARMMKRLVNSCPSSTTFGWGTTSPCSICSPWTFSRWPKTRVASWGEEKEEWWWHRQCYMTCVSPYTPKSMQKIRVAGHLGVRLPPGDPATRSPPKWRRLTLGPVPVHRDLPSTVNEPHHCKLSVLSKPIMMPKISGLPPIDGNTTQVASSPAKQPHCMPVLLVHTDQDAEHLGPDARGVHQQTRNEHATVVDDERGHSLCGHEEGMNGQEEGWGASTTTKTSGSEVHFHIGKVGISSRSHRRLTHNLHPPLNQAHGEHTETALPEKSNSCTPQAMNPSGS